MARSGPGKARLSQEMMVMRALIEAVKSDWSQAAWFHIPLSGAALRAHAEASDRAGSILGGLDDPGDPHITVLYMGKVGEDVRKQDIKAIAAEAGEAVRSVVVDFSGIGWFDPTTSSEGRTPIIFSISSPGLEAVNARLLRRLVPYTTKQQFIDYKPHATIGYFRGTLSEAQKRSLRGLAIAPLRWEVPEIIFSAPGFTKRFPLSKG